MMLAVCCALAGPLQARAEIPADTTDPAVVFAEVESRDRGDRSIGSLGMRIEDDSGRVVERSLRTRTLKFEEGTRMLFLVESPEDVRGTGFLSIDYKDGAKADDQWLYLPSIRRATRITSTGKSGAFFGSDLTYSDLTQVDDDDYNLTMVEQETLIDGEPCWVIEARPKTDRVVEETGYVKSKYWISKQKMLPLQAKHWVREGRKLKYMKFAEVENIDGIWTAKKVSVRVVAGGEVESSTLLLTHSLRFHQEAVTAADFTEQRLHKGL